MLLSEPLASLIAFFWTSLIKFYHNSQRMSDSFYPANTATKLKNKGPKHTNLVKWVSHVLEFLHRNTYVQCFDLRRHEILSHTCLGQKKNS